MTRSLADLTLFLEDTVRRADQPVEPLLAAANHWHLCLQALERLPEAVERVTKALAGARETTPSPARDRARYELQGAAEGLHDLLAGAWPAYRSGRDRLVEAGLFWGLTADRKTFGKSPEVLGLLSDAEVAAGLRSSAAGLLTDFKKAVRETEDAVGDARDAARRPPTEDADRKGVIDAGLDARDAMGPLFPRATAVIRRALELARRTPTSRKSGGDLWKPVWASDPEVADRES